MKKDWLGERLWNDLFCVERDVKPQLIQSINIALYSIGISHNWFSLRFVYLCDLSISYVRSLLCSLYVMT